MNAKGHQFKNLHPCPSVFIRGSLLPSYQSLLKLGPERLVHSPTAQVPPADSALVHNPSAQVAVPPFASIRVHSRFNF